MKLAGWLVFAIGLVMAMWFIAGQVASGQASAGDLVLALILGSQVNIQVAEAVTAVSALAGLTTTLEHRRWLESYADTALIVSNGSQPPRRLERGIQIAGLTFGYDGGASILDSVDLDLPAGATVALVGENGAGKTTLVKLLTKLYEPNAGSIRVDDVDLGDIDANLWRTRLTTVFQDFMRYEFIMREVVGLGEPKFIESQERVLDALERAGAAAVSSSVEGGLDAQLGLTFGGTNLSGGQWQQLALARGLMRELPLLQVLDEPTASLDPDAERAVFEAYARSARRSRLEAGAITLLVSHRFSTVRMADLIVVLDGGRVLESGPHEKLMDEGGLYAELFELQARTYR
jgi:ATP-binding cassette subfamily B protein